MYVFPYNVANYNAFHWLIASTSISHHTEFMDIYMESLEMLSEPNMNVFSKQWSYFNTSWHKIDLKWFQHLN